MRKLVPLVSVGAAALLVAGLAPGAMASSPGHGPKPPENPGRRYYQQPPQGGQNMLWGLGVSNAAVDQGALQDAMGHTFQAEGIYLPMTGGDYPTAEAKRTADNGARIYININSWRLVGSKKVCYPFSQYATHNYDAYLQKWVNDLQAFDYPNTFLTFTHEPTVKSDAQPGCGTASEYSQAYDYVFHYFRNHGVTYPFVWWMVASSFGQGYAQDWQPPAGDFSEVGVDGYNRFVSGLWRTPEYIFTASHDYAQSLGKPLVVGEIGTVEDGANPSRKADWIIDAANLFRSWNVDGVLWNDQQEYRPDSSDASLAGWVNANQNSGSTFLANAQGTPGSSDDTWGAGFQAAETVQVHLDSLSGPVVGSGVADATGAVHPLTIHIPSPVAGGVHALLAIGGRSGNVAKAQLAVSPYDPPSFSIAAGQTYVFQGRGFVPDETVTVQFPGGNPESAVADASGSADIPVVSPPEPHEGGHLAISAPSASFTVFFHAIPVTTSPGDGRPGDDVPVSVTGYGANETVNVKIDNQVVITLDTDPFGSASGSLPLDTTFGRHTISFVGTSSGLVRGRTILLKAWVQLTPDTGPTGTVVDVTSGPGWTPGESVQVKVAGVVYPTVQADANGVVDTQITIQRKVLGPAHVTLTGQLLQLTALADFTVTA